MWTDSSMLSEDGGVLTTMGIGRDLMGNRAGRRVGLSLLGVTGVTAAYARPRHGRYHQSE